MVNGGGAAGGGKRGRVEDGLEEGRDVVGVKKDGWEMVDGLGGGAGAGDGQRDWTVKGEEVGVKRR